METKSIAITPELAENWLTTNTNNRRVRPALVAMLAEEIRAGRWRETHQGIAFAEDGTLIDGQHRLLAVVAAKQSVRMSVTFGVPRDAFSAIDAGCSRTFTDRALASNEDVTKAMASIARVMQYGPDHNDLLSFGAIMSIINTHLSAIEFTVEAWAVAAKHAGMKTYRAHAVVGAVVARAYYTADRARLKMFLHVLLTGEASGPSDWAALKLRQVLDAGKTGGRTSVSARKVLYRKTEAALDYFLREIPVAKIYGESSELFPVPGERPVSRSTTIRREFSSKASRQAAAVGVQ